MLQTKAEERTTAEMGWGAGKGLPERRVWAALGNMSGKLVHIFIGW